MIEQGPDDAFHVPAFRKGCYYQRIEDCCWVCFVRFILSSLRQPVSDESDGTPEHPIIGMSVRIPVIDQSDEIVTHAEGRVIDVYQTESCPDIIAVELNNGSTISLGVSPSLQLE